MCLDQCGHSSTLIETSCEILDATSKTAELKQTHPPPVSVEIEACAVFLERLVQVANENARGTSKGPASSMQMLAITTIQQIFEFTIDVLSHIQAVVGGQEAQAPKKAAVAVSGGDSNLETVAKQFQLQAAVLKHPDSFAAYGTAYVIVEQQMQLIALEIKVRTAVCACCSPHFPLRQPPFPSAPYVTAVSPRVVAVRGCAQENVGKLQPNGMPKMISPAQMKTFNDCKARKEKMEADMESGALTPAIYAETMVRAHYPASDPDTAILVACRLHERVAVVRLVDGVFSRRSWWRAIRD